MLEIFRSLKVPGVRQLWFARLFSEFGDWAARLAISVLVYQKTGSAFMVGVASAMFLVPWLGIGQVLSTLGDRYERRMVMVICDVVAAAAFGLIALMEMPVWALMIGVAIAASTQPPFEAARAAELPDQAGEMYGQAVQLFGITYQTGLLVGLAGGGGLIAAFGARGALGVNAMTFLVSALFISRISANRGVSEGVGSSLRKGWNQVRSDPYVWWAGIVAAMLALATVGAESLVVVYTREELEISSTVVVGLLAAVSPIGALIGGVVVSTRGSDQECFRRGCWVLVGGMSIAAVLFGIGGGLAVAVSAYLVMGVALGGMNPLQTLMGRRLEQASRASAFGLLQGSLMAAESSGALLISGLAEPTGIALAVSLGMVPVVVFSMVALVKERSWS